jgi:glycosyltransferase involved in cell wall biosynthesis
MRISAVIPTYCEAEQIAQAVRSAAQIADEVIVVDGCSPDKTACQAVAAGAQVVMTRKGPRPQLQAGARRASGDVLLFLQPDARLPPEARAAMERALADGRVHGGTFRLQFDPCRGWARFFSWAHHVRRRWTRMEHGESALFIRRAAYLTMGVTTPSRRGDGERAPRGAHATCTVYVGGVVVRVSARRFEHVPARTLIRRAAVQAVQLLRIPPQRLAARMSE